MSLVPLMNFRKISAIFFLRMLQLLLSWNYKGSAENIMQKFRLFSLFRHSRSREIKLIKRLYEVTLIHTFFNYLKVRLVEVI